MCTLAVCDAIAEIISSSFDLISVSWATIFKTFFDQFKRSKTFDAQLGNL